MAQPGGPGVDPDPVVASVHLDREVPGTFPERWPVTTAVGLPRCAIDLGGAPPLPVLTSRPAPD
jgi:hypothetical protein